MRGRGSAGSVVVILGIPQMSFLLACLGCCVRAGTLSRRIQGSKLSVFVFYVSWFTYVSSITRIRVLYLVYTAAAVC